MSALQVCVWHSSPRVGYPLKLDTTPNQNLPMAYLFNQTGLCFRKKQGVESALSPIDNVPIRMGFRLSPVFGLCFCLGVWPFWVTGHPTQLPKADLLTFWFSNVGLSLVKAPKGEPFIPGVLWATGRQKGHVTCGFGRQRAERMRQEGWSRVPGAVGPEMCSDCEGQCQEGHRSAARRSQSTP